jgi:hypothetical protein
MIARHRWGIYALGDDAACVTALTHVALISRRADAEIEPFADLVTAARGTP